MGSLYVSLEKDEKDVIIALENIQKTYLLGVEGVPALRGVSLKIFRGEFIIIYGTSGGGKTSLLNIIGTIDKPTKGHLTICGRRITARTSDEELAYIRLASMGFVFQTFNLLSTMTALENVEMPMVLQGKLSKAERRARAIDLLTKVGMGKRLDHHPAQLSGGEQQRVTIARAIANRPEILLLDEPTGDLDTKNGLIVMEMLCRLNMEEKITMVMVTHDPGLKHAAHRVVYMRDGKIQKVESVSPEERAEYIASVRAQSAVGVGQNPIGSVRAFSAATEIRRPRDYETYSSEGVSVATTIIPKDIAIRNEQYPIEQSDFDITVPATPASALSPAAPTPVSAASSSNRQGSPSTSTPAREGSDRDGSGIFDEEEDPRRLVNPNASVLFGGSTGAQNDSSRSPVVSETSVEIPLKDISVAAYRRSVSDSAVSAAVVADSLISDQPAADNSSVSINVDLLSQPLPNTNNSDAEAVAS